MDHLTIDASGPLVVEADQQQDDPKAFGDAAQLSTILAALRYLSSHPPTNERIARFHGHSPGN